jgi:predicted amidohydrolase YtcJ
MLFLSEEQVVRFAKVAAMNDLQPAWHCVGDGAFEFLLDGLVEADKQCPEGQMASVRPTFCHGNFVLPDKWDTFKKLGAVIDIQPVWMYLDGAALFDHFGEERMKWFQPYRTMLDKGIPLGGGSDHHLKIEPERAINLYDPFLAMWTVITRKPRWTDRVLSPEEKITREEAIRLHTINAAYILHSESDRGSLEPGKFADFIVLDRNILTCPVNDILKTKVLETWLGGKKVAF